jgi:hypothetical protein
VHFFKKENCTLLFNNKIKHLELEVKMGYKKIKILSIYLLVFFLITGCQTEESKQVKIKMKSELEQKEILESYTYDDYKKVFKQAIEEAKKLEKDNKELNKWIIRTLVQEKLYYETDLNDEEVFQLSKESLREDNAWKSIAKNKYGVSVTVKEVDNFIKQGPDTSSLPQHLAYADALGLSLEELNHNFDRDIYEKNVIWIKLKPVLEQKFGVTNNNFLVEKYEAEVKQNK